MRFGSTQRFGASRDQLTDQLADFLHGGRTVTLLGSTGSIGTQGVQVIDHLNSLAGTSTGSDDAPVRVTALSAGFRSLPKLAEQAARLRPHLVATSGTEADAATLRSLLAELAPGYSPQIEWGTDAATAAARTGADVVLNGITGSIGLEPTLAALHAGSQVALANKESLIAGGELVKAAVEADIDIAYDFVKQTVAHGGTILFVGTKKQAQEPIAEQAARVGMPYVNHRWLGGMLTNFQTVSKRIQRMKELEQIDFADVAASGYTKKELLMMSREKDKLARTLGGIRDMVKTPSAVWIVDPKKEHLAVSEARKLNIPIVAILDTNADPDEVDYRIPGNDDAIRAVALLTRVIADAVAEGLLERSSARKSTTGEEAAPVAEPLAEWERELLEGDKAEEATLTRVIADAVAEGLLERSSARKSATGEEAAPAAEPLAEWERELLEGDKAEEATEPAAEQA